MSIVEEYWAGGSFSGSRPRSRSSRSSSPTSGERGRENEAVIARILEALVPQRYGIGSGLLIDTANQYSRQTDIVVFDQSDEPAVLAQTTQILFSMESVLSARVTTRHPTMCCVADLEIGLAVRAGRR